MSFHKRIILDFDDTLAFAENRDWANASPNEQLIKKTNALYDQGWTIDIFTARGSISCSSREEAARKYKAGMEEWLAKFGVKYNQISFEKPLAAYYVDDKGITPENFLNINIQNLNGGLSGSEIYTDGNLVHKQDKQAHIVKNWYSRAIGVNTPIIDRIVGETITMQYINHDKDFFTNNLFVAIGLIQETLNRLASIEPINDNLKFVDYTNRISEHVEKSGNSYFKSLIDPLYKLPELKRTFSHGDFGITNMLFTEDQRLFIIDPIPNVFGCTELDAAKFVASLIVNKYTSKQINMSFNAMALYNDIDQDAFSLLISAEIIRIYKYHPDKEFIEKCVRYVFE